MTGVERSPILAGRARARGDAERILEGDFSEVTPPGEYDLVCLFDVIEHVEDDGAFARRIATLLRPGQRLLLTVPACPRLYGPHDEMLHHYRRYSRRTMNRLLERSGFRVLRGTYFVTLLFPAFVLSRGFDKLRARLGHRRTEVHFGRVPGPVNALLLGLLRLEAALVRRIDLPIGVWYVALAERVPGPAQEEPDRGRSLETTVSTT